MVHFFIFIHLLTMNETDLLERDDKNVRNYCLLRTEKSGQECYSGMKVDHTQ